ncbi:MAG: hypothetical protein R2856_30750 [Caldilineaceae bacterium]
MPGDLFQGAEGELTFTGSLTVLYRRSEEPSTRLQRRPRVMILKITASVARSPSASTAAGVGSLVGCRTTGIDRADPLSLTLVSGVIRLRLRWMVAALPAG